MTAGIYMITGCAYMPTDHGDNAYFGKAEDIASRFKRHQDDLRAGRHHNSHLQNYFQKHGAEALRYVIISEGAPESLNDAEKKVIAENFTYENPKAFNKTPGGDGGVTHTLEFAFENTITGEKVFGDNVAAFCRLHPELNRDCMYRVHGGTQRTHKGWRRISDRSDSKEADQPADPTHFARSPLVILS